MRNLPVHAQILGGFLALQGGVLTATLLAVHTLQSRLVQAAVQRNIAITRTMVEGTLRMQSRLVQTAVKQIELILPSVGKQKGLGASSTRTLAQNRANLFTVASGWLTVNFVLVADQDGTVLHSRPPAPPPGTSIASWTGPASQPGKVLTVPRVIDGHAYWLLLVPLKSPIDGWMVLGERIDAWWDKLRPKVAGEMALGLDKAIVQSTLTAGERAELEAVLGTLRPNAMNVYGPAGRRRIAIPIPATDGRMTIYLIQDWDQALGPLNRLKRLLLAIGLVGMALTAGLGFFIAKGIARSTQRLIDRLTELNEFKSKFFRTVTHDLGSPLTVILSGMDWLKHNLHSKRAPKIFDSILTSTEAIHFLTRDLVDFAAMEVGKLRVELDPLDLRDVLADIATRMAPLASQKAIRFSVASGTEPLPVLGDRRRLAQALQNLVANAIHYTPVHGSVEVQAEVRGPAVQVEVRDSGIGISPQDLARVFDGFFQAANGRALRRGGFGLGLTIAREILQAHGGTLGARSELGRGSAFHFSLPLAREERGRRPLPALETLPCPPRMEEGP